MSDFGFEQPSAQPVNPRKVGFDLMQRAQEGPPGRPSPKTKGLLLELERNATFANARQEGNKFGPGFTDTEEEGRLDANRARILGDLRAERGDVGRGLTDKERVQNPEVAQPSEIPVGTSQPLNMNNTSTRAAALAVLDRVMAPDLNTPPTTQASITQVRDLGLSEDELQLMRQAGIL